MNKGVRGVDLVGADILNDHAVVVVDIDTIITEKSWLIGLFTRHSLTEDNRRAFSLCIELSKKTESVVCVACVGNREKTIKALHDYKIDYWNVVSFPDEETFKNWLKIKKPFIHLAINERKYYLPQSITVPDYIAQFS